MGIPYEVVSLDLANDPFNSLFKKLLILPTKVDIPSPLPKNEAPPTEIWTPQALAYKACNQTCTSPLVNPPPP